MTKQYYLRFTAVIVIMILSGCDHFVVEHPDFSGDAGAQQVGSPPVCPTCPTCPDPVPCPTCPPVGLNKVDLKLKKESGAAGTVNVSIKDGTGTTLLGSASLPANTIDNYISAWTTFTFTSPVVLTVGQKYRIYVNHPDGDADTRNLVSWAVSNITNDVDTYPAGYNNISTSASSTRILDYAFKTYYNDVLDQHQISISNYRFVLSNDQNWQEFVPGTP